MIDNDDDLCIEDRSNCGIVAACIYDCMRTQNVYEDPDRHHCHEPCI